MATVQDAEKCAENQLQGTLAHGVMKRTTPPKAKQVKLPFMRTPSTESWFKSSSSLFLRRNSNNKIQPGISNADEGRRNDTTEYVKYEHEI